MALKDIGKESTSTERKQQRITDRLLKAFFVQQITWVIYCRRSLYSFLWGEIVVEIYFSTIKQSTRTLAHILWHILHDILICYLLDHPRPPLHYIFCLACITLATLDAGHLHEFINPMCSDKSHLHFNQSGPENVRQFCRRNFEIYFL